MNTPWRIIFQYELDSEKNAQAVYDQLIKCALQHKFKNQSKPAFKVTGKILTEAVFSLNNHEQVRLKEKLFIEGQKLKELFVTSIFLKNLERRFEQGDTFFVVLPETDNGCDTAVIVVKKGIPVIPVGENKLKISPEHLPFFFQIKEYSDYQRLLADEDLPVAEVDPEKIAKIAEGYSEQVLVFMRDLLSYQSQRFVDFFKDHENCILISVPTEIEKDGEKVPIDPSKHNFIITFANKSFALEGFEWPRFLVSNKVMMEVLRKFNISPEAIR